MSEDSLSQRRRWLRFFPEGSIEFLVITRVLIILLLLALLAASQRQRHLVLLGLAGVLWMDYVLTLWWVIQIATDLSDLSRRHAPHLAESRRRRVWAAGIAALPSLALLLMVIPWINFVIPATVYRGFLARAAMVLLGIVFLVMIPLAYRLLRRIQMGPAGPTFLLLLPIVHWLALHRLLRGYHEQLRRYSAEHGAKAEHGPAPAAALAVAKVFWVLGVLPWVLMVMVNAAGGFWPGQFPLSIVPIVCTLCTGVFVVVDLAALECVQREFVALLRAL